MPQFSTECSPPGFDFQVIAMRLQADKLSARLASLEKRTRAALHRANASGDTAGAAQWKAKLKLVRRLRALC